MNDAAAQKIQDAIRAVSRNPRASVYGYTALRYDWIEDTTIPTMCTNGLECRYSPDFVLGESFETVCFGVLHEIGHIIHLHPERIAKLDLPHKPLNHRGANVAADKTLNPIMKEIYNAPDWIIMPEQGDKKGASMESLYWKYYKKPPRDGKKQSPKPGSKPINAPGSLFGEDCDILPLPKGKEREFRMKIASAIAGAIKDASSTGASPTGIASQLKDTEFEPFTKPDWRSILSKHLHRLSLGQYSYARPSRRSSGGFILPGFKARTKIRVVCFLDVSGSVDDTALNVFASSLKDLLENYSEMEVRILTHSTQLEYDSGEFVSPSCIELPKLNSGGGTQFECCYKFANENAVDLILHWTDLEPWNWPPAPQAPIVFLSWASNQNMVAPYGETIPLGVQA